MNRARSRPGAGREPGRSRPAGMQYPSAVTSQGEPARARRRAVDGAVGELVELRFRELARTRLRDILASAPHLRALSPELERSARERRAAVLEELEVHPARRAQVVELLTASTLEFLQREHQFLELEAADERALRALYERFAGDVLRSLAAEEPWAPVAGALRRRLAEHHDRLRAFVVALLERSEIPPDRAGVVCAEYSPELQLRVLGVRAEDLRAPLLDLGCGAGGTLVRHLRSLGHHPVWGLDRSAPAEPGYLRASWFSDALPPVRWRSVLAHQSFSLHFLHAHLRSAERAARYAERYMQVLRALAPGGRFLYAPGLPFIEEALAGSPFEVRTWPVGSSGLRASEVTRLA